MRRSDLPDPVYESLVERCTHEDGSYRRGRDHSPIIRTYTRSGGLVGLPLGVCDLLSDLLAEHDVGLRVWHGDAPRLDVGVISSEFVARPPQDRVVELARAHSSGRFRVATGVGKTEAALSAIARMGEPAIVVVPDVALAQQWVERVGRFLGVEPGLVGGGSKVIRPLTVVVPATPHRDRGVAAALARQLWGSVWVDECQGAGTPRTLRLLESLGPKRMYGLSADERRDDGLDEVAANWLGPVRLEVTRERAVEAGWILPVTVLLIPTTHGSRMAGFPPSSGREFDIMLSRMADDSVREELVDLAAARQIRAGRSPVLVLSHRVEHAKRISDRWQSGKLLGGQTHRREFQAVMNDLRSGDAQFAAGTIQSMGVGKDIRRVRTIVLATPFGRGWRRGFNQAMGRACRVDPSDPDKTEGFLVVLEDYRLYRDEIERRVIEWTGTSTEVRRWIGSEWEVVRAR